MMNGEEFSTEEIVMQYQEALKDGQQALVNTIGCALLHRFAGLLKNTARSAYNTNHQEDLDQALQLSFFEALIEYDKTREIPFSAYLAKTLQVSKVDFYRKHNRVYNNETLTDTTDPETQDYLNHVQYKSDPLKHHQPLPFLTNSYDKESLMTYILQLIPLLPKECREAFTEYYIHQEKDSKRKSTTFYRRLEKACSLLQTFLTHPPTGNLRLHMFAV